MDKSSDSIAPILHVINYSGDKVPLSEIEEGVYLDELHAGARLEVKTRNHFYNILYEGNSAAHISGHPTFCPIPTLVKIKSTAAPGADRCSSSRSSA